MIRFFRKMIPVLLLAGIFFSGCGRADRSAELKAVIERNMRGCQEKNLELVLATLDESNHEITRNMMTEIFARYDLDYRLTDFRVLSVSGDTAEVEITQETRKLKGRQFTDNRVVAIHTMRRRPDGWKILATELVRFEKL